MKYRSILTVLSKTYVTGRNDKKLVALLKEEASYITVKDVMECFTDH